MKNKIFHFLAMIILYGCSTTTDIVLPNGTSGHVVDCTHTMWSACFVSAGEICAKGYDIHERTKGEYSESKIPLTEMVEKGTARLLPPGQINDKNIPIKDKYMVISCKA